MTKKHEELVEEVEGIISRHGKILSQTSAKQIIALTLSAVRDGLELPGEVGRVNVPADSKSMPGFAPCFDKNFSGILIALRKEEE